MGHYNGAKGLEQAFPQRKKWPKICESIFNIINKRHPYRNHFQLSGGTELMCMYHLLNKYHSKLYICQLLNTSNNSVSVGIIINPHFTNEETKTKECE